MARLQKPSWLNPSERWVNQGEKNAPVFSLPDGRIFAPWQKRRDVTPQSIIGRAGVTAIGNYDADPSVRHFFNHGVDVRNIIVSIGGSGNPSDWTRDQVRAACATLPLNKVEGNDFGEGTFSFQPDSQVALWWYQKRHEMAQEAGISRRLDYGHHGNVIGLQGGVGPWYDNNGGQISPTNAKFRDRYQSVAAARNGVGFFNTSIGGTRLEDMVGFNVKNYGETPDWARSYFQKRFAVEIMGKGMGKIGGIGAGFLVYNDWPKLEGNTNENTNAVGNGNTFVRRIETPGASGTVRTEEHPQVDYDWQVGCYLVNGFLYADGVSTFDVPTRFGVDPSKMATLNTPGPGNDNVIGVFWDADNGSTPAPVTADGYPVEPNRWHDAGYEAAYFWSQFNRTEGVALRPLSYRFVGSETWIDPPADGASILEHAAAFDGPNSLAQGARRGRPTVDGRMKNNAFDFVVFDASRGKMYSEDIIVKSPTGALFQGTAKGCTPYSYNETL